MSGGSAGRCLPERLRVPCLWFAGLSIPASLESPTKRCPIRMNFLEMEEQQEPEEKIIECPTPGREGHTHRLAFVEWKYAGPDTRATPPTVVAVHGLSRHSRDFDKLARILVRCVIQRLSEGLLAKAERE